MNHKKLAVFFAVFSTGVAGTLMYPTVLFGRHLPDMGFLAWVFLVPLFIIAPCIDGVGRFWAGLSAGILFYGGSLYWFVEAMAHYGGLSDVESSFVLALVVLILSFYFTVAFSAAFWVHKKTKIPLVLLYPVFMVCADFVRTYFPVNGFPWSMPPYSQGLYLPYLQWVDLTGVYGLDLYIILVNALIAQIILSRLGRNEKRSLLNPLTILFFLVIASFCGSIFEQRRIEDASTMTKNRQIALVQGNIPQDAKWNPANTLLNISKYIALTSSGVFGRQVDLAVWPETAYPFTLEPDHIEDFPVLGEKRLLVDVLFGAVTKLSIPGGDSQYFNSAVIMDRDSKVTGVYHKRHLVPFGEYVPMKKWLKFAGRLTQAVGDLSPGKDENLLKSGEMRLGNLVCYEDIFPELARKITLKGANLLVNLTNDAWYGNTSAQYQHLVFSQFRALENRRYLVRATNTGITAIIDTRGEVVQSLPPFIEGVLFGSVQLEEATSSYTGLGDYAGWICAILTVLCVLFGILLPLRAVSGL